MLPFVKFNRGGTIVEPRPLSHAILASVRERDAHYVWAAQVGAARRAGVPEATIDILRAKGDPASLGEDERDIVTYTRQLVLKNRVDQAVFDRLQKRHGTQWLVELTAFAGYFGMLSGDGQRLRGGGPARRRQIAGVTTNRHLRESGGPGAAGGVAAPGFPLSRE